MPAELISTIHKIDLSTDDTLYKTIQQATLFRPTPTNPNTELVTGLGYAQLAAILSTNGKCKVPHFVKTIEGVAELPVAEELFLQLDTARIESFKQAYQAEDSWFMTATNTAGHTVAIGAAMHDPRIAIAVVLEESTNEAERIAEELEAYYLSL